MDTRDKRLLNEMRNAISGYDTGLHDPVSLGKCLLALRDMLELRDRSWFSSINEHLLLLDCVPTWTSITDAEKEQERALISNAVEELRRLVDAKIAQLS